MNDLIGLIMDFLVLLFLAATMFFAWNLSRNLAVFRKSRKDLDKLVQDLSQQIERADHAVLGLKNAAREGGKGLQELISEARNLSEELQLMTESGDNLAGRLERLAERNRELAERFEKNGGVAAGLSTREPALARPQEKRRAPIGPAFAIRDREIESGVKETAFDADEDGDGALELAGMQSKAERELMEAMRKNTKGRRR